MKSPPDLRTRALILLARREYSRAELAAKLGPYVAIDDDMDALLAEFELKGWLSDARFAESLAHDRRTRYGSRHIAQELAARGIPEHIAEPVLAAVKRDEIENARAVWRRKFGTPPATALERAKQTRFLAGRGFSWDVIEAVLRDKPD